MGPTDLESSLGTRQMRKNDIPFVINYWKNLPQPDRIRMGCVDDINVLAERMEETLLTQIENLALGSHASGDCEIWLAGNEPIGFSTLKNLRASRLADIHLHIARHDLRGKGLGRVLFCKSAVAFFDRWHLTRLLCEPHAQNPLPNKMLQKAGFPLLGSRFGASSSLSKEVQLNTYLIRYDIAKSWLHALGTHRSCEHEFFSSAAENGPPLLAELLKRIDQPTLALEFGSRSGQHAHLFTKAMPQLVWQASEKTEDGLFTVRNLFAFRNENRQLLPPLQIDLESEDWGHDLAPCYDLFFAANVLHAAHPAAMKNIFRGARACLKKTGRIWFYGPFIFSGEYTALSNKAFDAVVKTWNPPYTGLRDIEDISASARAYGYGLREKITMPVNNHLLIYGHVDDSDSRSAPALS